MISEQHSVRYVTVLLAFCRNQFIVFRDIFEKYIDECSSECDVSAKNTFRYLSVTTLIFAYLLYGKFVVITSYPVYGQRM